MNSPTRCLGEIKLSERATQMSLFDTKPDAVSEKKKSPDRIRAVFKIKEDDELAGVSSLAELTRIMDDCTRCELSAQRTHIVFGEGNPEAKLMLIGEGPGLNEDKTGRPFVGAAGQLLDRILASAGFSREEVFITNIVKCRPPQNRLPESSECASCLPYLACQMRLIEPKIVCCLGALATQTLVDPKARITRLRGTWHDKGGIKIMPTFHPAALLRDPSKKRPVWEDFQKIKEEYARL